MVKRPDSTATSLEGGVLVGPVHPGPSTVLLVDDEPISRVSMAARLKRMGMRVLEASNGPDGLALLKQERPDLVILDWMMPGMDGPSVCEAVRKDPSIQSCQILLMTAQDEPEQIAEGLARGADDFLSKSASKQEIMARVQAGLRAASYVRRIEAAHGALRAKQEELEAELQSAAAYVQSLLPPPGAVVPGVRMAWAYRPSLALGGDLFNLARWDEHTLYAYILDASGHGISPALRAAALSTFLRPENLRHHTMSRNPADMLIEANRQFPLTEEGDYFTLWIGVLDVPSGRLSYATAGHAGALVHRREHGIEWLSKPGLPLGFLPDTVYEEESIQLHSGDRLVLLSDGVYEVPSPSGELWGQDRLSAAMQRLGRDPLEAALPKILTEVQEWHGADTFPDDAALLGVESGRCE